MLFSNGHWVFSQHCIKSLTTVFGIQIASASSTPKKENVYAINKNISFRPALNSPFSDTERPLVLLYGWLVAKARHIYKYGDFYLGKGFDVIHVKVQPDQLLWPKHAQAVVENVLDFVSQPERSKQPILYHGFSVGGYLYGETLVKIHDDTQRFKEVGDRLRGQILDSPVDYVGIPSGFSKAVTDMVLLQKILQTSLEGYLKLCYNSATKHYMKSSMAAKENKLLIPTMFMYSKRDMIASHEIIEDVIAGYKSKGIAVYPECFQDSFHVGHFHKNPIQYINALNKFLDSIGMLRHEDVQFRQEKLLNDQRKWQSN